MNNKPMTGKKLFSLILANILLLNIFAGPLYSLRVPSGIDSGNIQTDSKLKAIFAEMDKLLDTDFKIGAISKNIDAVLLQALKKQLERIARAENESLRIDSSLYQAGDFNVRVFIRESKENHLAEFWLANGININVPSTVLDEKLAGVFNKFICRPDLPQLFERGEALLAGPEREADEPTRIDNKLFMREKFPGALVKSLIPQCEDDLLNLLSRILEVLPVPAEEEAFKVVKDKYIDLTDKMCKRLTFAKTIISNCYTGRPERDLLKNVYFDTFNSLIGDNELVREDDYYNMFTKLLGLVPLRYDLSKRTLFFDRLEKKEKAGDSELEDFMDQVFIELAETRKEAGKKGKGNLKDWFEEYLEKQINGCTELLIAVQKEKITEIFTRRIKGLNGGETEKIFDTLLHHEGLTEFYRKMFFKINEFEQIRVSKLKLEITNVEYENEVRKLRKEINKLIEEKEFRYAVEDMVERIEDLGSMENTNKEEQEKLIAQVARALILMPLPESLRQFGDRIEEAFRKQSQVKTVRQKKQFFSAAPKIDDRPYKEIKDIAEKINKLVLEGQINYRLAAEAKKEALKIKQLTGYPSRLKDDHQKPLYERKTIPRRSEGLKVLLSDLFTNEEREAVGLNLPVTSIKKTRDNLSENYKFFYLGEDRKLIDELINVEYFNEFESSSIAVEEIISEKEYYERFVQFTKLAQLNYGEKIIENIFFIMGKKDAETLLNDYLRKQSKTTLLEQNIRNLGFFGRFTEKDITALSDLLNSGAFINLNKELFFIENEYVVNQLLLKGGRLTQIEFEQENRQLKKEIDKLPENEQYRLGKISFEQKISKELYESLVGQLTAAGQLVDRQDFAKAIEVMRGEIAEELSPKLSESQQTSLLSQLVEIAEINSEQFAQIVEKITAEIKKIGTAQAEYDDIIKDLTGLVKLTDGGEIVKSLGKISEKIKKEIGPKLSPKDYRVVKNKLNSLIVYYQSQPASLEAASLKSRIEAILERLNEFNLYSSVIAPEKYGELKKQLTALIGMSGAEEIKSGLAKMKEEINSDKGVKERLAMERSEQVVESYGNIVALFEIEAINEQPGEPGPLPGVVEYITNKIKQISGAPTFTENQYQSIMDKLTMAGQLTSKTEFEKIIIGVNEEIENIDQLKPEQKKVLSKKCDLTPMEEKLERALAELTKTIGEIYAESADFPSIKPKLVDLIVLFQIFPGSIRLKEKITEMVFGEPVKKKINPLDILLIMAGANTLTSGQSTSFIQVLLRLFLNKEYLRDLKPVVPEIIGIKKHLLSLEQSL
ncbi:MAG: hypothetical protein ABII74_07575 [Elusimicrobiota bacterium]